MFGYAGFSFWNEKVCKCLRAYLIIVFTSFVVGSAGTAIDAERAIFLFVQKFMPSSHKMLVCNAWPSPQTDPMKYLVDCLARMNRVGSINITITICAYKTKILLN